VVEAALSLRTGEVVADPFRRTAELVELLRCHAAGVPGGDRRPEGIRGGATETRLGLGLAGAGGTA
jgi:hypothetical protein